MNFSDEYLLELALQGDRACFGELIERWQRKIYAFICRYVGNSTDAQDLTQDTFTKAYTNLDRLADPARFSSWLYKIALNECRMRFRKERRAQSVPLPEEEGYPGRPELAVETATPETQLAVPRGDRACPEGLQGAAGRTKGGDFDEGVSGAEIS